MLNSCSLRSSILEVYNQLSKWHKLLLVHRQQSRTPRSLRMSSTTETWLLSREKSLNVSMMMVLLARPRNLAPTPPCGSPRLQSPQRASKPRPTRTLLRQPASLPASSGNQALFTKTVSLSAVLTVPSTPAPSQAIAETRPLVMLRATRPPTWPLLKPKSQQLIISGSLTCWTTPAVPF